MLHVPNQWRVKDFDSFFKKIIKNKKHQESPFETIYDILGVRIITFIKSDLELAKEIVQNEFELLEGPDDKSKKLSYKEFGYRSIHYVVKLNQERARLTECSDYKDLRAEIQIRTIVENAWAEIEHHWNYKPDDKDNKMDNILKHRLHGLMAVLELVDQEFDLIRKSFQGKFKSDEINFNIIRDLAQSPNLFVDVCNYLSKNKKYEELVKFSKDAINSNKNFVIAWLNLVIGLLELHEDEKLLGVFDTLIKIDPNNTSYYTGKAFAYSELEEYNEALLWFDKALNLDPKNTLALVERGVVLDKIGKIKKAMSYFDKALELEPEYSHALLSKGLALDHLRKYDNAIKLFDMVLEKNPINTSALVYKGITLRNLKKYDRAMQHFEKVIELEPENVDALINKGVVLTDLNKNEEAIPFYEKVLEIEPKNMIALINITTVLADLEKCEEAMKWIDKALEIDPNNVRILFNKGRVYDILGRSEEAKNIYDMAFEDIAEQFYKNYEENKEIFEPELEAETVQALMGIEFAKHGEYNDAEKWITSALNHNPKNLAASIGKSFLLEKLEKYEDALDILKNILQKKPSAAIFFMIARIQSLAGDDKKALEYLNTAIKLDNQYKLKAEKDDAFKRLMEQKEFKNLTS
ncbi:MAG: tetratricopeptide repeat protein [Candidatus Odinarchaeota archaeon]